jgi:hypothetical protein
MKRFITKDFVVIAPQEWRGDNDLEDDSDSNLRLKRDNPEISLEIYYSGPYDNTNLDASIEGFKFGLNMLDHIVLSEGFINLVGFEGYRINSISSNPSEYSKTYQEGANIIFMKNKYNCILKFYSNVKSTEETNIYDIEDDISFICNNFQTRS